MTAETLLAQYGLAAVFVGAGLEGETATVAGGLLAHEGYWPLWAAMVAAAAGSFIADQLFFLIGRRFQDHRRVKRMRDKPGFARAMAAFERRPIGFIFIFRFLYGLRTISPIAIGTTQVSARTFMVVNAISAAVWAALFTGIGFLFGREFEGLMRSLRPHLHWLLLAAVVIALAGFGWRSWQGRRT